MKKVLFCSLAALTFAACQVEEALQREVGIPDGYKVLTIEASRDAAVSKTSYAGDVTFCWSVGDKISVVCNDGTNSFLQTFTATTAAATSSFTATVPENVRLGPVSSSSHRLAMFPSSDSHGYENDWTLYFHIPAEKDFRASSGGHASADIPMFACGTDQDVYHFAHLTGAVKFSFTGISCPTVKMTFTASGVKLNGSYKLYYDNIEDASTVRWNPANAGSESEKTVTYYGDVVNGEVSFYLPYAAGSIWGNSTLTLSNAATDEVLYTNSKVGTIAVTRNKVTVLPVIDVRTGSVVVPFSSAYNIDWSGIASSVNTDATYPAIKLMKATADDDYLYLYMEVDPSVLTTTDQYDHQFKVYFSDPGGSSAYWGSAKATYIHKDIWAVAGGNFDFLSWSPTPFERNVDARSHVCYYEVRIARTHEMTSSLLYRSSLEREIGVGVILDDLYVDSSSSWRRLNNNQPYGVIPSYGTAMYPVTLPASASVPAVDLDLSFSESDEVIANPERGLYKMVEYKYRSSGWTSATTSLTDTYDDSNTLTLTLFYLMDFVESDQLSEAALTHIGNVFSKVRSSGKKAIVRFAYSNVHENKFHNPQDITQEPSLSQLQTQIGQIAPVLEANKDVIYVVQAGFIGTYGEWYYTTHFSKFGLGGMEEDPSDHVVKQTYTETRDFTIQGSGSNLSVTGFGNRKAVLDALLAAVPSERQINLRTPTYKQCYLSPGLLSSYSSFSGFGTDPEHRLGFHNDAFLYGGEDMGTFHYSWERSLWQSQGAFLVNGGEAPYSSTDVSQMEGYTYDNVRSAIFDYHYSYLHHDTGYHTAPNSTSPDDGSTLMRWWHRQGWMNDIKKWLGYRLYLDSATISGQGFDSGSSLTVSVTLNNSGAAPIVNERPMKLVLLHGGTPTVLADMGDPRTVASQDSQTFSQTFTLPRSIVSGDQLALWLPDAAEGLQDTPAYSVRLANDSSVTWSNGYNIFYTF